MTKRDALAENGEAKKVTPTCGSTTTSLFEYKGANKHKDLAAAYRQLLLYKDALKIRPCLWCATLNITKSTPTLPTAFPKFTFSKTKTLLLQNLLKARASPPCSCSINFSATPKRFAPNKRLKASRKKRRRRLLNSPTQWTRSITSRTRRRLASWSNFVFCLFCEDVGLLPKGIFSKIVHATKDHPKEFSRHLRDLFGAMAERAKWSSRRRARPRPGITPRRPQPQHPPRKGLPGRTRVSVPSRGRGGHRAPGS